MIIAHNMAAINAQENLNITGKNKNKAIEKLSSGYKINRAADNAAGLAISEKMRSQIRGLNQSSRNVTDGVSLVQVADGALNEIHAILQRMRELSVQAANDTNSDEDRNDIKQEIDMLTKEVDRIANDTNFNQKIYPLRGEIRESSNIFYVTNVSVSARNYGNNSFNGNSYTITTAADAFYKTSAQSSGIFQNPWGMFINTSNGEFLDLSEQTIEQGIYEFEQWELISGIGGIITKYHFEIPVDTESYLIKNDLIGLWGGLEYSVDSQFNVTITNRPDYIGTPNNNNINKKLWLQMGAQKDQGMFLELVDATAKGLAITDPPIDVTSYDNASSSIFRIDNAINKVCDYRSYFGAQQNRLECAKNVDDNIAENTQYAESRIRDADMADEMVTFSAQNILEQAGMSVLAQANQSKKGILSLLG